MNEALCLLYGHRSDRDFSSEPVSDEALNAMVEAARRAPTSCNAQHVSLVVVRDAAKRARIAELSGGQPWVAKAPLFIAVILDFYKTGVAVEAAGEKPDAHETVEGLLAGVTDVGYTLATLAFAARSFGMGMVPIGGIRRNSQAMIDLLELPPRSFPVVGISIGHITKPAPQKPRLPMETFRHNERYHTEFIQGAIAAYDATLMDYWKSIGRTDGQPWSKNTAVKYKAMCSRDAKPAIEKQGLTHNK